MSYGDGLSGFVSGTAGIDKVIAALQTNNLQIWRVCNSSAYPHISVSTAIVDYYLNHTPSSCRIILDMNHSLTMGTSTASNWPKWTANCLDILSFYKSNNRVWIEPVNEYRGADLWTGGQTFIDTLRNSGYTNPIVINKFGQWPWRKFVDPLNMTYQGDHYYMNLWTPDNAVTQLRQAQDLGCQILNTEIGAHSAEGQSFTVANVALLNDYLAQCAGLGIDNCIWMLTDTTNYAKYVSLGLVVHGALLPPVIAKLYDCPFCDYASESEALLASHIRGVHPETLPPEHFDCPFCELTFGSEAQLGTHIRSAHPEMPPAQTYPCPYCDLVFTVEAELGTHIRSVHPEEQPPKPKSFGARSIGPFGVPSGCLNMLWRLRQKLISEEAHRKLHPLV